MPEDLLAERGIDVIDETLRRNKRAALKLPRKWLRRQDFLPDAIVTERLKSYGAALRDIGLTPKHQMGGRLNNALPFDPILL